jgi:hypothetical protein
MIQWPKFYMMAVLHQSIINGLMQRDKIKIGTHALRRLRGQAEAGVS